jgi:EmrB/QacA subfamily drug resistance transporter
LNVKFSKTKKESDECQELTQTTSSPIHVNVIFGLVIAAAFLDIVDFSIIQVALPTIRQEFLISLPESQWIVGAYGLTLAGFLLLSGRAGDLYGQKNLFVLGVTLFTISSLMAGLSPSFLPLVISRAIQGIGAAISTVTALAIFATIFPEGPQRNRALGIFVAVLSAGFAAGSITGGVLTAALGWRSVLFVNVPIGAATVLLSLFMLPNNPGRCGDKRLDLPGSLMATSGTILFVYSLTNAATEGFAAPLTITTLAFSIVILASFIVVESRSKAPLMPLSFLRRRRFLEANIITLIIAAASGGLGFIVTIYMQQILGYSPLATGLAFLPSAVVFLVIGGWGSSRLLNRFGVKSVLTLAMIFIIIGNALLALISETGTFLMVEPGTILWALGASIGFPALYIVALGGIKPGEEGLASGIITTSQRIGFPLGLAVLVAVASVASFQSMGASSSATTVLGFRYAFIAATIMSIVGLAIVLLMKKVKVPRAGSNSTPL